MYPMSPSGSIDGFIFTPGPAGRSDIFPVARSIETRRVSLPGLGAGLRFASVCSAVMQYVTTVLLLRQNFGLPQKLPCGVMRSSPDPSGCTTYRSTSCCGSHRPRANGRLLSRSDANAIHVPSGDHDGR